MLSGGEKARLALAKMLTRPANLLLLDEPTNHLDLRSREVLEDALNEYEGTLVLTSHDRYFINRVVTSVAAVGGGTLTRFDGDYDAFLQWKQDRDGDQEDRPPLPDDEGPGENRRVRQEERRREAEERNRRYRQRKQVEDRLAPIEDEVGRLELRTRELEAAQGDPQVYSDPDRAREVGREKGEIDQRLRQLYADWERLADELD